jgi:DNA-binding PadR family transcriptional regulator
VYHKDICAGAMMKKSNSSMYAILGWLTVSPRSGYDLKKSTEDSLAFFWSESYGQIYPTLKKMVDEELVTVQSEQEQGRPVKKIYSITTKGRSLFSDWLKLEPKPDKFKSELLLKVFFGFNVDKEVIVKHLENKVTEFEELIQEYGMISKMINERCEKSSKSEYWTIPLDLGIRSTKVELEWAKDAINRINNIADEKSDS